MKSNKAYYLLLFVLIGPLNMWSQQQNLPLNREFNLLNTSLLNDQESSAHTALQPYNQSKMNDWVSSDNPQFMMNLSKTKKDRSWFMRKLLYENFIVVDTGEFYLTIDPLMHGEFGVDSDDNSGRTLYRNTRGLIVRANVGDKFSFETSVYENQMVAPNYLNNYIISKEEFRVVGVVPGQGRVKRFKQTGYDFAASSAVVTYAPSKRVALQIGTGKHFIGDGYRSLLLSDYSFNYPFLKFTGTFGKNDQFQYTKLHASLSSVVRRDLTSTPEALFERKTMSTHYFNWIATKWLHIGLFESTLWQTEDSTGTSFQAMQLNPVIGVNTAVTGFEAADHSVVGTNVKLKLPFKTILYSQFVYDGASRFGYQAGARYFGVNGLNLQAEYNAVEPRTYTSAIPLQAYSNYNEPIAHPLGSDFQEIVGILNYQYKRAFTQMKLGLRTQSSVNTMFAGGHLGIVINPKNNLAAMAGIIMRSVDGTSQANYIHFGIQTNLRNLYNDF